MDGRPPDIVYEGTIYPRIGDARLTGNSEGLANAAFTLFVTRRLERSASWAPRRDNLSRSSSRFAKIRPRLSSFKPSDPWR